MCSCARLALACWGALALAAGAKDSGMHIVPPEDGLPSAVSQRPAAETTTLRCWQEGRLVLEQTGVQLAEAPAGALVFRKNSRTEGSVSVFDMKHGLCVLSKETAAPEPERPAR